jgi:hypothetical protein
MICPLPPTSHKSTKCLLYNKFDYNTQFLILVISLKSFFFFQKLTWPKRTKFTFKWGLNMSMLCSTLDHNQSTRNHFLFLVSDLDPKDHKAILCEVSTKDCYISSLILLSDTSVINQKQPIWCHNAQLCVANQITRPCVH